MSSKNRKYFVHIDGDSFFAACEIAARPYLRGKPVVVGEERGIATAMSKEAKAIGIVRGDPIYKIKKEFPTVHIIQSHFDLYEKYCQNLFALLKEVTDNVECYSIDECFFTLEERDLRGLTILEFVSNLKKSLQENLGITYSLGVAYTKVIAKLASKHDKPDGLTFFLDEKEIIEIYKNKDVYSVWGIGYQTSNRLNSQKIYTIYDFVNVDHSFASRNWDKPLLDIWNELKSINRMPLILEAKQLKSMQATRSFTPSTEREFVFSELSRNVESACLRLIELDLYTNEFIFFIRTHVKGGKYGKTYSRLIHLDCYSRDIKLFINECGRNFDSIFQPKQIYKKSGVHILNILNRKQIPEDLFGVQVNKLQNEEYTNVYKEIKSKFGSSGICFASSLESVIRRKEEMQVRNSKDNYIYDLPLPYLGVTS